MKKHIYISSKNLEVLSNDLSKNGLNKYWHLCYNLNYDIDIIYQLTGYTSCEPIDSVNVLNEMINCVKHFIDNGSIFSNPSNRFIEDNDDNLLIAHKLYVWLLLCTTNNGSIQLD
jgi:hypothetical protein